MKTPIFLTTEDFMVYRGVAGQKVLPAGSFVKPIEIQYVPKHVTEAEHHRFFNPRREVFVYCHYGIVCIPQDLLRSAG